MKNNISRNTFWIISGVTVLVFALLALFFPYSGDDWAWGSYLGIERLKSLFENYNGRYLGNLLVIVLTRSKILNVIAMAVSYYLVCWACMKYAPSKSKKSTCLVFSVILFFIMPKSLFTQTVVWTSGFSNYVPAALISVFYMLTVRNITKKAPLKYPKLMFIATFAMGFCGALFIENVTLFNICLGVAVILYTLIFFRKLCLTHISFLAGSALGAIIMFSNSAYSAISGGTDAYRESALGTNKQAFVVNDHIYRLFGYLFTSNLFMILVICALVCALVIKFIKKSENKILTSVALLGLAAELISCFLIFSAGISKYYSNPIFKFAFLEKRDGHNTVCIIFMLAAILCVCVCCEKGKKFRIIMPFLCVPVVCAPLVVVNPLGERCIFAAYLFMMMFAVSLFSYIIADLDVQSFNYKAMFVSLGSVLLAIFALFSVTFLSVYRTDAKRNKFVQEQVENGETTVIISTLPNEELVWMGTPQSELWTTRYKLFHNLPSDIEFECIPFWELDSAVENYSK